MDQSFMKTRKILPLILSMSLPMVLSMAVNSLYNIVDSYFIAKMGEDAITALSLVFPLQNMITAIAVGWGIGVNASIAFFMGAAKQDAVNQTATQSFALSFIHGILITIVGFLGMPAFLRMFTNDTAIIDMALIYANRILIFAPVVTVGIWYEKVFQAIGKMKVSMFSMICGCVANIVLDPLLIFGIGFFPEMGIRGAAYATGIGQCVTLVVYVAIFAVQQTGIQLGLSYLKPDSALIGRIYRVGIPATLNLALPSLQISVLNGILSIYSGSYILILGIYNKLQTFIYLTANGIVQGIRPLVAYNAGAGEEKRVKSIFHTSLLLILIIMGLGTVISMTCSDAIFAIFTTEETTIRLGAQALRIISLGFIVSGISVACSGVFEGLGEGLPSLYISLSRYIVIMLPCAFILSRLVGVNGVWYAFGLTELLTAMLTMWLYKRHLRHR